MRRIGWVAAGLIALLASVALMLGVIELGGSLEVTIGVGVLSIVGTGALVGRWWVLVSPYLLVPMVLVVELIVRSTSHREFEGTTGSWAGLVLTLAWIPALLLGVGVVLGTQYRRKKSFGPKN